jgi:hypothetical protein
MAGKRLTIGSRAVAVAILSQAIQEASTLSGDDSVQLSTDASRLIAGRLADLAWDVEYKPTVERLVLTISAGIEAPDRTRPARVDPEQ